jgi:ribosomal protein S18 acetylase RimI-like enzyme
VHIRPATWADRPATYEIALLTGDSGADARALHHCPDLIGEVFVGPYLRHSAEHAFVLVDDDDEPSGYVLGVADTPAFEAALGAQWWAGAQERARACLDPTPADAWVLARLADPVTAPSELVSRFPAHGHIDLVARAQGQGFGRQLMSTVMTSLAGAGAPGMHLEVGRENARALAFYGRLGFEPVLTTDESVYVARSLD